MPNYRDLANAIRALTLDSVQRANSGHPGMPLGMADIASVLWSKFLVHNPQNPKFFNRDRFILSNGHGSMLQYALLHLTGYDLSIDELKNFRQLHSKTPGHPEYGLTPGVETTTGPLGQGLASAVGMAIGQKLFSEKFNTENFKLINHYTYCFVGDGCLMEGISHEVSSLAGTLALGKLIVFWDDNGISIDGEVEGWFKDDTPMRFKSYGWQVITDVDGHDYEAIEKAINKARDNNLQPTLICCKTKIGFGSPNFEGKAKSHGAPLGEEEVKLVKIKLGINYPAFEVSDDIYKSFNALEKGKSIQEGWDELFKEYEKNYPEKACEFKRRIEKELPENIGLAFNKFIDNYNAKKESIATRKSSKLILDEIVKIIPELIGGSADLSCSNLTYSNYSKEISNNDFSGNYIHYGVREFGMSAIMNGLSLYGGLIPYGGTFLTFLDYSRNAVRMSALMKTRVIYVFTHDSIGLGEDGPTHQPIEHAMMLRATPNMSVWRPCDTIETAIAWKSALENLNGPTSLLLSRQNTIQQERDKSQIDNISKGGYILWESKNIRHKDELDIIIISTGSEVEISLKAAIELENENIKARVISMPCVDVFLSQNDEYKESVLPSNKLKRIAVEAGVSDYWYKFVGLDGKVVGIDSFGESAPAENLYKFFNITSEYIIKAAKELVN